MSSTETSNRKRRKASSTSTNRNETTATATRARTTVAVSISIASLGFESLVDDTLDLVLQFVGKGSYKSYGGINRRCRKIFLNKNLPKRTFLFGYAPLSMIQEKLNNDDDYDINSDYGICDYSLGQAVVYYNRNDILHWLLLEKNKKPIMYAFDFAAEIGLNTLERVKNLVGDDTFIDMKINEGWNVCLQAACHERLDVLKWLKNNGWFNPRGLEPGMKRAANKGNIPVLKWLIENGCEPDGYVFFSALEGGHLNMLQFLKDNKCPLENRKYCMREAARGGSLETIQWLLQNKCSFDDVDEWVIDSAARRGHLHVILFFIENGISIDDVINTHMSYEAAKGGHLHILKWLHENNCIFDEKTFEYTAREDDTVDFYWSHSPFHNDTFVRAETKDILEKLQWLLEINCPFNEETFAYAATNGNINILQWLLDNNFPWNKKCYAEAADAGLPDYKCLEVLEWLKEKRCPQGDNVLAVSMDFFRSEIKDWLLENGFTLEEKEYYSDDE